MGNAVTLAISSEWQEQRASAAVQQQQVAYMIQAVESAAMTEWQRLQASIRLLLRKSGVLLAAVGACNELWVL